MGDFQCSQRPVTDDVRDGKAATLQGLPGDDCAPDEPGAVGSRSRCGLLLLGVGARLRQHFVTQGVGSGLPRSSAGVAEHHVTTSVPWVNASVAMAVAWGVADDGVEGRYQRNRAFHVFTQALLIGGDAGDAAVGQRQAAGGQQVPGCATARS